MQGRWSHWCSWGFDHQAHANAGQWVCEQELSAFQGSYRGQCNYVRDRKSYWSCILVGTNCVLYVQHKLTQRTESGLPRTGSCSRVFYSPLQVTTTGCVSRLPAFKAAEIEWEIRLVLSFLLYCDLRFCFEDHKSSSCCSNWFTCILPDALTGSKKLTTDRWRTSQNISSWVVKRGPVRTPLSDKVQATMGACIRTIVLAMGYWVSNWPINMISFTIPARETRGNFARN